MPFAPQPGRGTPDMDIRPLDGSELVEAATLLSQGMCDNPINVAVFGGDRLQRQRMLAPFFLKVLRGLETRGRILGAFDGTTLAAVCGMTPAGRCQPSAGEKIGIVPVLMLRPAVLLRVLRWAGDWASRDPGTPHWHLGPVATDPSFRGKGFGGALVTDFCVRVNEAGASAYLETDKAENVAFYRKYGFEVTGHGDVLKVPNWFMTRSKRR
jgi:ribosomal protein S18 acetylase RimI-like enzyme